MQNSAGLKIFTTKYLPSGTPKGIIFIIHGAGEYCERYGTHVAEHLNSKGFAVFTHDHQGHGRSEGPRMHVADFQDYVNDTIQYMKETLESNPEFATLPRFVWGHSMGGLISCHLMLKAAEAQLEFTGLVVTGPALMLDPSTDNAVNRVLARTLSMLMPRFAIPWEKGPVAKFPLTHVEEIQKAYMEDPLVYHGCLRVGWSYQFMISVDAAVARAGEIKLPVLGVHGAEDGICIPEGTEKWVGRIASTDKKFLSIPDSYHEMHNETDEIRKQVLEEISGWCLARLTPPKPVDA